jgi:hypothetical protein
MERPHDIFGLIRAFGGPSEFAKIIERGPSTASEMKRSGSIRVEYWPKIIAGAAARKIPGITLKTLALMNLASHRQSAPTRRARSTQERSRASA